MEASQGYTGPYPTEAAAEAASGIEGPGPLPEGGEAQSAQVAPPSVVSEGHQELEGSGPTPSTSASPSATTAVPVTATSVGSSPGSLASPTVGAALANGEAAAGYSGVQPTVDGTPTLSDPNKTQLERVASPGPPAIASRTAVLPEVAATPDPLAYKPGHTS